MPPQAVGPVFRPGEWIERAEVFFRLAQTGGMGMSQDPGQGESPTVNQESPQKSAWAHWQYTPDEWAQLDRLDWGRAIQRYWFTAVLGMLSFLAGIALFLWLVEVAPGPGSFGIMALVPLLLLLFSCVVPGRAFHKARKRHRARKNASQPQKGTLASQIALRYNAECEVSQPLKVTLSGQGLWMAGTYFPLAGHGVEATERLVMLREVRLSTRPTMLHFRVDSNVARFSKSGVLYSYRQETIPLLVPAGYESEAEHLPTAIALRLSSPAKASANANELRRKRESIHPNPTSLNSTIIICHDCPRIFSLVIRNGIGPGNEFPA